MHRRPCRLKRDADILRQLRGGISAFIRRCAIYRGKPLGRMDMRLPSLKPDIRRQSIHRADASEWKSYNSACRRNAGKRTPPAVSTRKARARTPLRLKSVPGTLY
jgi:hypothetical protein